MYICHGKVFTSNVKQNSKFNVIMKSFYFIPFSLLFLSLNVFAQKKHKKEDVAAIKSMCGCYEVSFNFAETFHYNQDSTYTPSKTKHDKALEWVQLVSEDKDQLQLQHLLIASQGGQEFVIKHWRQDWMYENSKLYEYNGDNHWNFEQLSNKEVAGQWTQKVYQVDDSPRYEGSASWVHVDGKSYWENTTTAPLPRREYTKRSDYNVTLRRNRHEITKNGWIHDQDNDKVQREEGKEDVVIAQEKGFNSYTKVADEKCKKAQDWWQENNELWAKVRTKWTAVYGRDKNLVLAEKVDNKKLFKLLFSLEKGATDAEIEAIIDSFVK